MCLRVSAFESAKGEGVDKGDEKRETLPEYRT